MDQKVLQLEQIHAEKGTELEEKDWKSTDVA